MVGLEVAAFVDAAAALPRLLLSAPRMAAPVGVAPLELMGANDPFLMQYMKNGQRVPGMYDVVGHGDAGTIEGMSANALVRRLVLADDYAGTPIRLVSCNTGACAPGDVHGVAQGLANKLRVDVMAPTDYLHIFSDGTYRVGPLNNPWANTGSWMTFRPME
jgi:hypothetical protein